MTFAIDPGTLGPAFDRACARLAASGFIDALWARRTGVWTSDAAVERRIADRLGWLGAIDAMRPHTERLDTLAAAVRRDGLGHVILLGMGGSSLVAETLRGVLGTAAGCPRFHVLDSVDPDAVRGVMAHAVDSLFVVASKSGSTIEVAALAEEAERRVRAVRASDPGSRFIAITDAGTPLHRRASEGGYRDTFVNPADVGGRFSALTFFGLVPAALMGIDVGALLACAQSMATACRLPDPRRNPGTALGAILAAAAAEGRDKLMLRLPDALAPLGLWVEQLVAESTGKEGRGIVPIVGDPHDPVEATDRIVVDIQPGGAGARAGHETHRHQPRVRLAYDGLGGEFFRWEIATATAGFLLGVNPFDEPNVQQAKDATRALLDAFSAQGRLPSPDAHGMIAGCAVTLSAAAQSIAGAGVAAVPDLLRAGDYFGLLAYLPPDESPFAQPLQRLRATVAARSGCAATLGYGPRYLHSTGQLHKGGPNRGVFLVVTAEPAEDLPVPGQAYSFGTLELAQALGDFQALDRLGRRALLVRLPKRDPTLLQQITDLMSARRT